MAVEQVVQSETYVEEFRTRMREGFVGLRIVTALGDLRVKDIDVQLTTERVASLMQVMGDPAKPVFLQMAEILDQLIIDDGYALPAEIVVSAPAAPAEPVPAPTPEPSPAPADPQA